MVFVGDYEHSLDAKNRLAIPREIRAVAATHANANRGDQPGLADGGDSRGASGAASGGAGRGANRGASDGTGETNEGRGLVFYVTPGEDEQCLCLYTESMFHKRAEQLDNSSRDPDELLAYEELFYGLSRRVATDAQGRIRLPDSLLERAGLDREVVLVGVKDHVRIYNRPYWQARMAQRSADGSRRMLNPRRMM